MRTHRTQRKIVRKGGLQTAGFGIRSQGTAKIFRILRDFLYGDKILAVLREIGGNAWDSHRAAGKPDLPIRVVLPTSLEPSLVIRDWGPGLRAGDPDEPEEVRDLLGPSVFGTFIWYGDTTKDETDEEVGSFGIGAKSPFAYNDSFSVASWHGGLRCVYSAMLDESDEGEMTLFHMAALGEHIESFLESKEIPVFLPANEWVGLSTVPDLEGLKDEFIEWLRAKGLVSDFETGLEVKVPVVPSDSIKFHNTARDLFRYFEPQPDINVKLKPAVYAFENENGGFVRESPDWTLVMGCIPYRVRESRILPFIGDEYKSAFRTRGGILRCDIGEVSVTASREDLEYTERTVEAVVRRFTLLCQAAMRDLVSKVTKSSTTDWEKRISVLALPKGLPLPPELASLNEDRIKIFRNRKSYGTALPVFPALYNLRRPVRTYGKWSHLDDAFSLPVSSNTRILIKDTHHTWRGYAASTYDRIVMPKRRADVDAAEAHIRDLLEKKGMSGVPILRMSSLEFTPPDPAKKAAIDTQAQHKAKVLSLKEDFEDSRPRQRSSYWDAAEVVLSADDVYVLTHRFRAVSPGPVADPDTPESLRNGFFVEIEALRSLFRNLKVPFPKIYGIKNPKADRSKIPAKPYAEWKIEALLHLFRTHPELKDFIKWARFSSVSTYSYCSSYSDREMLGPTHRFLVEQLGPDHEITKFAEHLWKAQEHTLHTGYVGWALSLLEAAGHTPAMDPAALRDDIIKRYPLLGGKRDRNYLGMFRSRGEREHWVQYVKLMDTQRKS